LQKRRRKFTAFKGRRKALSEPVQINRGNLKLRYKNGHLYKAEKTEKEKRLITEWRELTRSYMGQRNLIERVSELEGLLKAPQIELSLVFTRLHYQSNGKPDEAKKCEDLLKLIKQTLGD